MQWYPHAYPNVELLWNRWKESHGVENDIELQRFYRGEMDGIGAECKGG